MGKRVSDVIAAWFTDDRIPIGGLTPETLGNILPIVPDITPSDVIVAKLVMS